MFINLVVKSAVLYPNLLPYIVLGPKSIIRYNALYSSLVILISLNPNLI